MQRTRLHNGGKVLPPDANLRALGVEVARLRKTKGWSIDRLAEHTGVHRKTIIEVEAGRVAAKISTIHAIGHALGVDVGELVRAVCADHGANTDG